MAIQTDPDAPPRVPLSRERVLRAAVVVADRDGIESLTMRKLGQELSVEAMSLYKHVANKEDVLDGVVDVILGEIDQSTSGSDWKAAMRHRSLSARAVLVRHPWAAGVIESRTTFTPSMLTYMDSVVGMFLDGGFSMDLTHHAMHALGSRILGFTQELFKDSDKLEESPEVVAVMLQQLMKGYPNISAMLAEISHDDGPVVGDGCDDQTEFEFGLDLLLDGLERLRQAAAL